MVMSDMPGSSLDPSGTHVAGQKSRTAKMGLDCTIPLALNRREFVRGRYGAVDLAKYLG